MNDILLETIQICKSFAALRVTHDVSLAVRHGEMHAIIGPNGAGKTTLIGQITGEIKPDSGRIVFAGHDITAFTTADRARLGLARTFQIISLFDSLTAGGNVVLGGQATEPHNFKFWQPVERNELLWLAARNRLNELGLAERSHVVASYMSHGERRQLELAMALATRPSMLLLDEPMAGLGSEECEAMMDLLARLKGQYTILLIEHDMDVVFSLADRISVLVGGRIIASGTAKEIRRSPEVQAAYLGEDADEGGLNAEN